MLSFKHLITIISLSVFSTLSWAQNVALDFDGTDDYVQTTYSGIQGSAARTVEAWIKTTANTDPNKGGKQVVVADYGSSATGGRFTLNVLFNYAPRIEIQGSGLTGTIPVNDGNWHHIAAVYNPSATLQYTLYVDGKKDTAGNIPTSINTGSATNFMIGKRIDNTNLFIGSIDEVRFYNTALTDSVILANYKREFCKFPSSLVAYYKLNEGNAGANNSTKKQAFDYSGNSNHGTLYNFNLYGSNSNWVTGSGLQGGNSSAQINIFSCNAYTSPSGKYSWSFSGNYKDTLKNYQGCDSVLSIQLTIGRSYITRNIQTCDSFISPKGNRYFQSGTYIDSLISYLGCDSIIRSEVTIHKSIQTTIQIAACDSFVLNPSLTVYSGGNYVDTLKTFNGCDSLVTYFIEINHPKIQYDTLEVCDSFSYGQKTYYQSALFTEKFSTSKNCDSIINTYVMIHPSSFYQIKYRGCDTIFWNNLSITRDTSISELLINNNGCDSTVEHIFNLDYSSVEKISISGCRKLVLNGISFEKDTSFKEFTKTSKGCDSIAEFSLHIIQIDTTLNLRNDTLWAAPGMDKYQWILCSNNSVINGATMPFFPIPDDKAYAVILTKEDCSDTSQCMQTNTGFTDRIAPSSLYIFPNPSRGRVQVNSLVEEIRLIEIYSSEGRLVHSFKFPENIKNLEINLDQEGIFIISITTAHGKYHQKVVNLIK